MNFADGYTAILAAAIRGARPDPELHVDQWSEQHMVVPKHAARPGKYRIEVTPMARRIMQCLSPRHPCRRVMVKGASQMLKTQVALNWLMASSHLAPGNMLVLEPTDSLAKRLSARVQECIRNVPVLDAVFAKPRGRDSRNTIFAKDFTGGTMYIATAGAAANLAEIPARYVYIDEIRELWANVDGQGDPIRLAEARTTQYGSNKKILLTSSPGLAGSDPTDEEFDRGTQEVYLVPCPHCGHHHELNLAGFHFERDPDSGFMSRAWFACPECGAEINEGHKPKMLRDEPLGGTAHWHARSTGDGDTTSFHYSAFYAPAHAISWRDLAREYAHAKQRWERGDPNGMQVFYNNRLALSWSNTLDSTTAQELMARASCAPRVVPEWALVVTIDVDTQVNRLEVQAQAWGAGHETAVIDHQVLMGSPTADPADPASVWARLDEYRRTPFAHASGVLIPASITGIDSGGANTSDVYHWGGLRTHTGVLVHHGATRPGRPVVSNLPSKVDIDWNGRRIDNGCQLWQIGTDTAKDHLWNRFKLAEGHGAMHFNTTLPLAWYEQLLAERPFLRRKPGGGYKRVWDKANAGDRNEALDLAVGNLALYHHLGLHKWSAADWARLRRKLVPEGGITPDLFVQPPAPPPVGDVTDGVAASIAAPVPVPIPLPAALPPIPMPDQLRPATPGRRALSKGQYR